MRNEFSETITGDRQKVVEFFNQFKESLGDGGFVINKIPKSSIQVKSVCLDFALHKPISCTIEGIATKKGLKLLKKYYEK